MTCASMVGPLSVGPLSALVVLSSVAFGACAEPEVARREWRASDHQPPPAVAPEGQGAAPDDEGGDPQQRAAMALWGMRCATCHGVSGRGDGQGRPPGAALPDMTAEAFHNAYSDAQLASTISLGKGLMPAFRTELTEQGILALVGYIRTLRQAAPAPAPGTP